MMGHDIGLFGHQTPPGPVDALVLPAAAAPGRVADTDASPPLSAPTKGAEPAGPRTEPLFESTAPLDIEVLLETPAPLAPRTRDEPIRSAVDATPDRPDTGFDATAVRPDAGFDATAVDPLDPAGPPIEGECRLDATAEQPSWLRAQRRPWEGAWARTTMSLGALGSRTWAVMRNAKPSHRRPRVLRRGNRWVSAIVAVTVVALAIAGLGVPYSDRTPEAVAQIAAPTEATQAPVAIAQAIAPATVTSPPAVRPALPAPAPADTIPAPSRPPPTERGPKRPPTRPSAAPAPKPAPVAQATETRPSASTTRPARRYVVQLATYATEAQARAAQRRIEGLGLRAFYQVVQVQGARRYRMRVGPFASRAEADAAHKQLAASSFGGRVLTL